MTTLNIRHFPDGTGAYFFDERKNEHFQIVPGNQETFNMLGLNIDRLVVKSLKIDYETWRKRYARRQ